MDGQSIKGFKVNFSIMIIGSIKPWKNGVLDNGNAYKASVRFRSTLVEVKEDEDVGFREVETIIDYKIPCDSNIEATELVQLLYQARKDKKTIIVNGALPKHKGQGTDQYEVMSFDMAKDFIKMNDLKK